MLRKCVREWFNFERESHLRRISHQYHLVFIPIFMVMLVSANILPVTGATLPVMMPSAIRLEGEVGYSLDAKLQARLAEHSPGELISVVVVMKSAGNSQRAVTTTQGTSQSEWVIRSLQAEATTTQAEINQFLQSKRASGKIANIQYFWIVNGFSLQATAEIVQDLAARTDVAKVFLEETFQAPAVDPLTTARWDNLGKINAPALWAMGFTGQGIVVASLDTGVDLSQPELSAQWRGGNNSWYDPYGKHLSPADLPAGCASRGHGTATMGVMVGKTVGVAPNAQWIAVKIFDDDCSATTTGILLGFEWLLDPDHDPSTPDAPQVVNSSWGGTTPSCGPQDPTGLYIFQPALLALRGAGILPVFSAGNSGTSGSGSSTYPGNYPEAFPVGATDSLDTVASYSARGPNYCINPPATYPELTAPGSEIYTAGLESTYATLSGTSFAAPHVAGSLALLLSAFPEGLSIQQQESALVLSAVDLGASGADDSYGYGRLDIMAAYQWLLSHPDPIMLSATLSPSTISESAGSMSLTLNLNQTSFKPITVSFAASSGTATEGIDYVLPDPVTFNPGDTRQTVLIHILSDLQPESDENIKIHMVLPDIVIPASPQELTAVIQDDDIQVGFEIPEKVVSETDGRIFIFLTRMGGVSFPAAIEYQITGDTAVSGVDYQLQNGRVSFAPGETQKPISVILFYDETPGPSKTLSLGLGSPEPISVQFAAASMTLTILNVDPWLIMLPFVSR